MEYDIREFNVDLAVKKREEVGLFTIGIGGSISATPTVDNKTIYFGACDTYFYALDIKTGIKLWNFKTGDFIASRAAIYKDMIYFGSSDKYIYALSKDGELVWKFLTGGRLITSSPFVVDNVVYCGSADGYLYALNYSDGRLLWKFKAGSHIINTPVVINDSIYFGSCDNKFYCLSTEGIKRWDFLTGDVITCYPAVADQKGNIVWNPALYCSQRITEKIKLDSGSILFGCDDTFFYSIDIDGKLRWKIKTGDRIRGTNTSVFNGQVFFGSYDRNLRCVSFDSGRLKWSFMAGGPIVNNNIYGKNIYFGSYDGIFHAITIDGKSLWEFQTGGPIPSCPIIIDDVVYFGSWDTYFYALSLKTQKPLWKFQTGFGFQSPVKLANVIAISDKKTEINWVPETKTINEYGKVVSEPTAGSLNPYKQKGGYFVDKSREGKKSGAYT